MLVGIAFELSAARWFGTGVNIVILILVGLALLLGCLAASLSDAILAGMSITLLVGGSVLLNMGGDHNGLLIIVGSVLALIGEVLLVQHVIALREIMNFCGRLWWHLTLQVNRISKNTNNVANYSWVKEKDFSNPKYWLKRERNLLMKIADNIPNPKLIGLNWIVIVATIFLPLINRISLDDIKAYVANNQNMNYAILILVLPFLGSAICNQIRINVLIWIRDRYLDLKDMDSDPEA